MKAKSSTTFLKSGFALLGALLLVAASNANSFAKTQSDYDHTFTLSSLSTWEFADRKGVAKDAFGKNGLWNERIRDDTKERLAAAGFNETNGGAADFLVSYHMATKEQVRKEYISTGTPGYWFRMGRWRAWGSGWRDTTVFEIPVSKSTLVMDVIDAKSDRILWRGYDTETINFKDADKTINKAVENLVNRFDRDVKESAKRQGE